MDGISAEMTDVMTDNPYNVHVHAFWSLNEF